jgi:hypothetical protein
MWSVIEMSARRLGLADISAGSTLALRVWDVAGNQHATDVSGTGRVTLDAVAGSVLTVSVDTGAVPDPATPYELRVR